MKLQPYIFSILAISIATWGYIEFINNEKENEFNQNKGSIVSNIRNSDGLSPDGAAILVYSDLTVNNADKLISHDSLTNGDDKKNEDVISTELQDNNVVFEENGKLVFDEYYLKELSLNETFDFIASLPLTITNPESLIIMENINEGIGKDLVEYEDMNLKTVSCSDKLCGIVISSENRSNVDSFLDLITSKPIVKEKLKGGSLKIVEDNGEYYGVLFGAIGNMPIQHK